MAQKWEVQSKRDATRAKTGSPDTRLRETTHGTHTKEAGNYTVSQLAKERQHSSELQPVTI